MTRKLFCRATSLVCLLAAASFAHFGLYERTEPGWRFVGGFACLTMLVGAWRWWWKA